MPSVNTYFYTEIDDGSGEVIKLGSRVKPQRSYTLGSSTNEPQVFRSTYHVDAIDLGVGNVDPTKIFDINDIVGPSTSDVVTIVEIWLRSRGMNAVVTYATDPALGTEDSDDNSAIELKNGVWQPLMFGTAVAHAATAELRAYTEDRERITKIFAMGHDDSASAASYCLVDIVVITDIVPADAGGGA